MDETPKAMSMGDAGRGSVYGDPNRVDGLINFGCCKSDPDDLFAYSVPKTVKIRSWPVGVLNYVLTFAVIINIIYGIFHNEQYLLKKPVIKSAVTATVYAPYKYEVNGKSNSSSLETNGESHGYCCDCHPNTAKPLDPACLTEKTVTDAYSGQFAALLTGQLGPSLTDTTQGDGFTKTCCVNLDPKGMRTSTMVDTSVTIATRVSTGSMSTSCKHPVNSDCEWQNDKQDDIWFVRGVEDYTIGLQHSYSDPDASPEEVLAGTLKQMTGKLVVGHGEDKKAVREWPSAEEAGGQVQDENRMFDIFTVKDLLKACDLLDLNPITSSGSYNKQGLDQSSNMAMASLGLGLDQSPTTTSDAAESLRSAGMQIIVFIEYSQVQYSSTSTLRGSSTIQHKYNPWP
jgi:hypothetical protein